MSLFRITRRTFVAILASSGAVRAHDGLHATAVGVAVHGVNRGAAGELLASLTVTNGAGIAVTLRGVDCDRAKSTRLLRRASLLGVETWTQVDLLRLEPGEAIDLAPPDYVIQIVGAPPGEDLLNLRLDFGPAGEKTVVLFVTD